jgi:3-oxoacyl-[acyl-carrier protein] reductase
VHLWRRDGPDPYMFGSGMTNRALLNLTKSLSAEFGED